MKQYFCVLFLLVALLTSACGRRDQSPTPAPIAPNPPGVAVPTSAPTQTFATQPTSASIPVPAEYQPLYKYLDGKLDNFSAQLNALLQTDARELTFAAELIVANGNRGENLLLPQTFGAVQLYLDRLQALGVRGVKVAIKYPLLTQDFPRSSEYLAFYKKVSRELKRRNLKMLAGTGVAFTQPEFSSVQVNYRGMTLEKLKQGEREQIVTIIREIRPDYVTVANEPSTQTELTGVPFGVKDYTDFVNFILKDLDRRSILIGAGTGNWDDPAFIESLAKNTTVDYIDIHFYPVNHDFIARAIQQADIARANGKRLIVGETWLYKASENEVGGASAVEIFARDGYRFWQPLDEKFLTFMTQFARAKGVEFMSPFWSKYFFGYADYNQIKRGTTNREILRAADAETAKNIAAGMFSGTGLTYRNLTGIK